MQVVAQDSCKDVLARILHISSICKCYCKILALCIWNESCTYLAHASAATRFLHQVSCKNLALILQVSCVCKIRAKVFSCKYLALSVRVSCTVDVHRPCKDDVQNPCRFLAHASDLQDPAAYILQDLQWFSCKMGKKMAKLRARQQD